MYDTRRQIWIDLIDIIMLYYCYMINHIPALTNIVLSVFLVYIKIVYQIKIQSKSPELVTKNV